jgi:hypothetical protein
MAKTSCVSYLCGCKRLETCCALHCSVTVADCGQHFIVHHLLLCTEQDTRPLAWLEEGVSSGRRRMKAVSQPLQGCWASTCAVIEVRCSCGNGAGFVLSLCADMILYSFGQP